MARDNAGTVFVQYVKGDDDDFAIKFIQEAKKLNLKIRTVDAFYALCANGEDWSMSKVREEVKDYVRESICFVWIFSRAFIRDKKMAVRKDTDREADFVQKLLDIIFDHFVIHGDARYSSARMFTICHHTTREELRDIDCVMASYAPLDSSCGPLIAAQLLKLKVDELQEMKLSDEKSGGAADEGLATEASKKKDGREATVQKPKKKRRLVTDTV